MVVCDNLWGRDRMLVRRVFTAIVGIPVLIFAAYRGGLLFYIVTSLIAVTVLAELLVLSQKIGFHPLLKVSYFSGLVLTSSTYMYDIQGFLAALSLGFVLTLVAWLRDFQNRNMSDVAVTFFSLFYVAGSLSYLILLRQLDYGYYYILLTLLLTWASDTGAYFVGKTLGRHKLSPKLSPNKSWEGVLGGAIFSILVSLVFYWYTHFLIIWHMVTLGLLVPAAALTGDLVESAIKRIAHVKDSGVILPGHGGFFDRFDSLMLTAPVVYYYLVLTILN